MEAAARDVPWTHPASRSDPAFMLSTRVLCSAKYLLPGATEGNSSFFNFLFFLYFPSLIPFLPFPSCLAGGHWYLFQTGIKVMGEGWLSAAHPAVALFCLVNGVRHGIRIEHWSYPCVRRIKGPKSIKNSERSQRITNKLHFIWLPDPTFWKEERLLLFGIIFFFYRMVKTTLIWVNQINFDLQIKFKKKKKKPHCVKKSILGTFFKCIIQNTIGFSYGKISRDNSKGNIFKDTLHV